MNLPSRTILRILRDDLGVKAYQKYTGHLFYECLKHIRLERSKVLKCLYGKELFKEKVFTNKKIFTLEEKFNH